jgi:uncharacterized protein YcaQ
VMPLLYGDRIIARFDLAADRKAGVLNVIGERWEPGWEGTRRPVRATKRALDELASFLGVDVMRRAHAGPASPRVDNISLTRHMLL